MATPKAKGWSERIGRRLKLRDLHVLLAVADARGMARAAAQLGISRPVVSKTIADLEYVLGVNLVERAADGVELTSYGRALVKWSMAVFDDLRQGVNEIGFLSDPSSGRIRVGCPEVIASGLMPEVILRLSRKYPRAVVEVVHATQAVELLFQQLRERSIDILLGRIPVNLQDDDLSINVLFDDRQFVVAGANSRWARKRKIDLAELVDEPWVLPPPDHFATRYIGDVCRARGLKPPAVTVVSNSRTLVYELLASGRYLAVAPEIALHFNASRKGIVKLPLNLPPATDPIAIVTLAAREQPPLLPGFIECATAAVRSIPRPR
jgi:DNA-binding transcriptional LysR family regulator